MKTYEEGFTLLIARLRLMHSSKWSPTPKRKEAESIATKIDELADLLEGRGVAQFDIEVAHDRPPEAQTGLDGWPEPVEDWGCSYKGTIGYMRDLADSARRVAADLPNPRTKHALPFAAMALLHLRYRHGVPRPMQYSDGEAVRELERACVASGIVLSTTTLRGALADALREFDPYLVPDYFNELLL